MKGFFALVASLCFLSLLITVCTFGVYAAIANAYIFVLTLAAVTFAVLGIPLGLYCYRLIKIHAYKLKKRERSSEASGDLSKTERLK